MDEHRDGLARVWRIVQLMAINVRSRRMVLGWTQYRLALDSGLSEKTIALVETVGNIEWYNKQPVLDIVPLIRIAAAFDVDLESLMSMEMDLGPFLYGHDSEFAIDAWIENAGKSDYD